jgi:hypothetical protein
MYNNLQIIITGKIKTSANLRIIEVERFDREMRARENGRSLGFYYLGKALIQELGEDKGTALIVKQIEEMAPKREKQ